MNESEFLRRVRGFRSIGLAVGLTLLVALMASACSPSPSSEGSSGKVTAAATTTMVADLVRSIGGDEIKVVPIMGPGVDPHLYKPSASDISHLRKADVIFYNGLLLEGRMTDTFTKMARQGAQVYAVTEDIPRDALLAPKEFDGHWDPHVWFDPELWTQCIDVVAGALTKASPRHEETFKERAKALKQRYAEAHRWAKQRTSELPKEDRILVTSHDAFNYFGQAYDFEVVGVQGLSTVTEAGLADVAATVDLIKKRGIEAIFVESSVSPAAIQRISKDSGAKIGGELFSDAMGAPGDMETGPDGKRYDTGTWPGMLRHNINTVVEALK